MKYSMKLSELPVHPHACGEHYHFIGFTAGPVGSSPRLWGTLWWRFEGIKLRRFIPTPVGNTPGQIPEVLPGAVHPHACGEHDYSTQATK